MIIGNICFSVITNCFLDVDGDKFHATKIARVFPAISPFLFSRAHDADSIFSRPHGKHCSPT